MSKAKGTADKNLTNVAEDLEKVSVNPHHGQQMNQDTNDRRHRDALSHEDPTDLEHQRS